MDHTQSKLHRLLADNRTVIADGAMGTMLFEAGLENGASPELWNVEQPEKVYQVHRGYVQAGSQLILTNSFGGTRFRLALHQLEPRLHELNKAAAQLARRAADEAEHLVLVGGSIGPTGELLDPLGVLTFEEAVAGFAEQAAALRDGGVDYFQVETMSDLGEIEAAINGIRQVSTLPIIATMTFDTNRRTMMGVTPAQAARRLSELKADVIGANCGNGVDDLVWAVGEMRAAVPDAILFAKSNAGVPRYESGGFTYDGTPDVMAEYAQRVQEIGVQVIGACCGSTPAHIHAIGDVTRAS